jgi:hypothetical protein
MSVYTVVGETPKNLSTTDFVIEKPTFLEEIAKSKAKRGVNKLTTAPSLRDIFMAITDKYDNTINPYHLKLSKYEGIKFDKDEDLIPLIYRIISDNNLNLIEAAVDLKIKTRPLGAEVIYYVTSDLEGVGAFAKNGVSALKLDKKGKETKNPESVV